ncbi:unnamed protein product [Onchocerca ochengi]|uniref:Galectin domain-containing protein n=1 Tax=Onchocerca ochengi TaxID=42157 RepID=A0A182DZZ4_ONCOC|nr:unnamed protein product [Onchocerca ochengi]
MSCDIGSVSLDKSYSDSSVTDSLKGWSSPFPLSSYEYDSPKTAVAETSEILKTGNSDRNENCQTFARSMDIIKVDHNLETTEEMLVSFPKQLNYATKIVTNSLPDINTQATSRPSVSWIERSSKIGLSTNQTVSSTTSGRGIFERDCDLPEWLNANENQTDHYDVEMKPSIQTKDYEISNRNNSSDILVKAHGCIKLALQAPTPITFILTGMMASPEIRVRKLFVNGQKYVFV